MSYTDLIGFCIGGVVSFGITYAYWSSRWWNHKAPRCITHPDYVPFTLNDRFCLECGGPLIRRCKLDMKGNLERRQRT